MLRIRMAELVTTFLRDDNGDPMPIPDEEVVKRWGIRNANRGTHVFNHDWPGEFAVLARDAVLIRSSHEAWVD